MRYRGENEKKQQQQQRFDLNDENEIQLGGTHLFLV